MLGLLWAILWLLFPYNRLRPRIANAVPIAKQGRLQAAKSLPFLRDRGFYAVLAIKGLADPIFYFYLFYLPKFLHDSYDLDLGQIRFPFIVIYTAASVGSIVGGWLSGALMKRGYSVNLGRKAALLLCALCVVPVMLVPRMHSLFPGNAWPAIGLFCLATAAHQGWSANVFAICSDLFLSSRVSTVVSLGGAAGAVGGALFTWFVSRFFSAHPMIIFSTAAFAYLTALFIFQILMPNIGRDVYPVD